MSRRRRGQEISGGVDLGGRRRTNAGEWRGGKRGGAWTCSALPVAGVLREEGVAPSAVTSLAPQRRRLSLCRTREETLPPTDGI